MPRAQRIHHDSVHRRGSCSLQSCHIMHASDLQNGWCHGRVCQTLELAVSARQQKVDS